MVLTQPAKERRAQQRARRSPLYAPVPLKPLVPAFSCTRPRSVVGAEQAGDSARVVAGFSDGNAGEHDLVVGAGGIGSTVRRLALSPVVPEYAGTMTWRSLVPVRPTGADHLMTFMGKGRLERFRRLFEGFGAEYLAALESDEQLYTAPTEWVAEAGEGLTHFVLGPGQG